MTNSPLLCKRSAGSLEKKEKKEKEKTDSAVFLESNCSHSIQRVSQSAISNQNMFLMVETDVKTSGSRECFCQRKHKAGSDWSFSEQIALWPQINWKSKVASGITARMQSCCLKEHFFLNLSLCSYLR